MTRYALLYLPPCGVWYVHSHKMFDTEELARQGARKFLPTGTEYAVIPVDVSALDETSSVV